MSKKNSISNLFFETMCSTRPIVPKNFKGTAFSQNALIVLKLKSAPEKKSGKLSLTRLNIKCFFFAFILTRKFNSSRTSKFRYYVLSVNSEGSTTVGIRICAFSLVKRFFIKERNNFKPPFSPYGNAIDFAYNVKNSDISCLDKWERFFCTSGYFRKSGVFNACRRLRQSTKLVCFGVLLLYYDVLFLVCTKQNTVEFE